MLRKLAGRTFELATDIKDEKTRTKFSKAGWRFRSPHDLSVNYWVIAITLPIQSRVHRRQGSIRSIEHRMVQRSQRLLSGRGRPVITQETGFTKIYASKVDSSVFASYLKSPRRCAKLTAIIAVIRDAAREIAREFFEAEKVLASLLDRAGL
jgi:hypothetical protein